MDFYEERDKKTLPIALRAKDRLERQLGITDVELREQIVETAIACANRRVWFAVFEYDPDMSRRLQEAWGNNF
jgi:hypothetical protein